MSTRADFLKCLPHILKYEGGYSDHSRDPGGATNMGITQATLANWRKKSVTKEDVLNLTVEEAADIYKANYWDSCRCDDLPLPLALVVFDCAVNSGIYRAGIWLQATVHAGQDGKIGNGTLAALKTFVDAREFPYLINGILDKRLAFLQSLKTWDTFGKGWSVRVESLRKVALSWAQ